MKETKMSMCRSQTPTDKDRILFRMDNGAVQQQWITVPLPKRSTLTELKNRCVLCQEKTENNFFFLGLLYNVS